MRVLHLDAGKTMRGGQWQALRLIEGLQRPRNLMQDSDLHVTPVEWASRPAMPAFLPASLGSSTLSSSPERIESTLLSPAGSPLASAALQSGIRVEPIGFARAAILARRHDLIHAHDSRSHTIAALAGGAPLVVSRRVAFGGAGTALARWKYGRAARYIAVSEFVKRILMERGVPIEKIVVVHDGVPLLESACQTPTCALAPANAADPRKGAALALEGARRAGIELRLSDNLERDLPNASLFLYITYSEGLGSGVLLAMSAGVPVVASNVGGLPEIVRHGENGLLVENEPEAIAAAVRTLIEDPGLARSLGRAGRRTVAERFTVERMVRGAIGVYRQVLS